MSAAITTTLIEWFRQNGRDLPWRHTRDPYRILVSELMLQQTQVERVIPKYHAFLDLFPDVYALASAPTSAVITAWQGLGYNRRAIYLQRTAQAVVTQYDGQFPHDVAALRALPGIGDYTSGAIACFAFGQDVAFLDTNIRRVVLRVWSDPHGEVPDEKTLRTLAAEYVPAGHGWWWNQAIMELGAVTCTATKPKCPTCPLRGFCNDYAARLAADQALEPLPQRPARRVAERKDAPFIGSNRYIRGRIIDYLRQMPTGTDQPALTTHLATLGLSIDETRLTTVIAGLVRDGLIHRDGDAIRLPE
ncbi:MAG: A/G-specific adenine glycosylase [Roseiflexaceae bacterium]